MLSMKNKSIRSTDSKTLSAATKQRAGHCFVLCIHYQQLYLGSATISADDAEGRKAAS